MEVARVHSFNTFEIVAGLHNVPSASNTPVDYSTPAVNYTSSVTLILC